MKALTQQLLLGRAQRYVEKVAKPGMDPGELTHICLAAVSQLIADFDQTLSLRGFDYLEQWAHRTFASAQRAGRATSNSPQCGTGAPPRASRCPPSPPATAPAGPRHGPPTTQQEDL